MNALREIEGFLHPVSIFLRKVGVNQFKKLEALQTDRDVVCLERPRAYNKGSHYL
jgi:hypothetical protein